MHHLRQTTRDQTPLSQARRGTARPEAVGKQRAASIELTHVPGSREKVQNRGFAKSIIPKRHRAQSWEREAAGAAESDGDIRGLEAARFWLSLPQQAGPGIVFCSVHCGWRLFFTKVRRFNDNRFCWSLRPLHALTTYPPGQSKGTHRKVFFDCLIERVRSLRMYRLGTRVFALNQTNGI